MISVLQLPTGITVTHLFRTDRNILQYQQAGLNIPPRVEFSKLEIAVKVSQFPNCIWALLKITMAGTQREIKWSRLVLWRS